MNSFLNGVAMIIGFVCFWLVLMYKFTSTGAFWSEVKPIEAGIYLTLAILIPIVYLILVKCVFKLPVLLKTIFIIVFFSVPTFSLFVAYYI